MYVWDGGCGSWVAICGYAKGVKEAQDGIICAGFDIPPEIKYRSSANRNRPGTDRRSKPDVPRSWPVTQSAYSTTSFSAWACG